jgi:hypothetical protein
MQKDKRGRKKNIYIGQQSIADVYREKVETPPVEPHCNCEGAYTFSGLQVSGVVKYGSGNMNPTKLAKDRETCEFCGHYVLWQIEGNYNRSRQHRV